MSFPDATLQAAVTVAANHQPASWEGVEALAVLALAAQGRPDAPNILAAARAAADRLYAGSWESVRALAWLSQAERAIG